MSVLDYLGWYESHFCLFEFPKIGNSRFPVLLLLRRRVSVDIWSAFLAWRTIKQEIQQQPYPPPPCFNHDGLLWRWRWTLGETCLGQGWHQIEGYRQGWCHEDEWQLGCTYHEHPWESGGYEKDQRSQPRKVNGRKGHAYLLLVSECTGTSSWLMHRDTFSTANDKTRMSIYDVVTSWPKIHGCWNQQPFLY